MPDALAAADLVAALRPQVFLVKVDAADRIIDVRQAPLEFLLANLAADKLQQGDAACKSNVGHSPWLWG